MMQSLVPEKVLREQILMVSAVTIWQWRRQGRLDKLKTITIGDRRYYRPSDITDWMDELAIARPNKRSKKWCQREGLDWLAAQTGISGSQWHFAGQPRLQQRTNQKQKQQEWKMERRINGLPSNKPPGIKPREIKIAPNPKNFINSSWPSLWTFESSRAEMTTRWRLTIAPNLVFPGVSAVNKQERQREHECAHKRNSYTHYHAITVMLSGYCVHTINKTVWNVPMIDMFSFCNITFCGFWAVWPTTTPRYWSPEFLTLS